MGLVRSEVPKRPTAFGLETVVPLVAGHVPPKDLAARAGFDILCEPHGKKYGCTAPGFLDTSLTISRSFGGPSRKRRTRMPQDRRDRVSPYLGYPLFDDLKAHAALPWPCWSRASRGVRKPSFSTRHCSL